MSDLSDGGAIEAFDRGNPARRCTAHKKTGERCRRWAIKGGTVCTHHGGRAPAVKAKARRRIEEAADRMARELLKMAVDDSITDATKLGAIKHALAIGGLSEKTAVEVEVGLKPYEQILADITGVASISRAEHEAARVDRGLPARPEPTSTPELSARPGQPYAHELNVVDAEYTELPPTSAAPPRTPVEPPSGSPPPFAAPPAISGPTLQTEEEAMADIASANRAARSVQVRRVRRR